MRSSIHCFMLCDTCEGSRLTRKERSFPTGFSVLWEPKVSWKSYLGKSRDDSTS